MKRVEIGDFIIHLRSFQGGLELSRHQGRVSPAYTVCQPREGFDVEYGRWLLKCSGFIERLATTTDQLRDGQAIKFGLFRQVELPVPPITEQRSIASYLDRETTEIDALVAAQEELISTLRERRAAVIDRAIAAHGGPTVTLSRLRPYVTSGSRGWGDYYADHGERFARIGNLGRGDLRLRGEIQHVRLPTGVTEGARTKLRLDDLLLSITAYLGSVSIIDDPSWVGAYTSQHVALCRFPRTAEVLPRYVGYALLARPGQDQLKMSSLGGTKQGLSLDDVRALRVPLPPIDAQRRTTDYLDEKTEEIDALIAETERFIVLAKERRATLVTAAVTGQIDHTTRTKHAGASD
ncbi:restriction endonuclease subunit S [Nocardioides sp. zg-DK7169]|uniref:restriction endonuclease subunit S n=1 Tax=Nocardioides sp. zg-DK7169 TaxID=2736600 RepID=UPI001557624F|nr:restriction endonuclease subunit S [Nocardioides sp. zg-DK7169]NPC98742.1 restriction endonuclease subunit S [Nocardioides sp. zg-DK7169]